ncbi:MAG: 50S ribosomal protein L19 [Spirochaetota bacterium]|nr:50S ribosomal protein L19 [Spirochaetota bacterium]
MEKIIEAVEEKYLKDVPVFHIGDTIRVSVKIREGKRERLQAFEGIVIAVSGRGISKTFKVRRVSFGIGVERTFLMHSPFIEKIQIIRHGKVRRAKLYYLRDRIGKAAQVKEKIIRS